MTNTLQYWHSNGYLSDFYDAKNRLNTLGINDYDYCELQDLKKLCQWYNILESNKWRISIPGSIQKMVFFSVPWNNNLIIAVNGGGTYAYDNGVNLLIYEMPYQKMEEIMKTVKLSHGNSWSDATSKIWQVESALKGENPILYKSPNLSLKSYKNYRFRNVKIHDYCLPSYDVENNPDYYFKPLDIAKVHIPNGWFHSSIYLGGGMICNAMPGAGSTDCYGGYYNSGGKKSSSGSSEGDIQIMGWGSFLNFFRDNNGNLIKPSKVVRLHPIVPYKNKDRVIQHLAEAIEGSSNYYDKRGRFRTRIDDDGKSNNCEHFVNLVAHAIDISEYTEKKKYEHGHYTAKSTHDFYLPSKFSENHSFFNGLTSYQQSSRINQIKNYTTSSSVGKGDNVEGIKMQARIEVQPKTWYRLS